MLHRKTVSALTTAALLALVPTTASAALLASDTFSNYIFGTDIDGQGQGTGWANTWTFDGTSGFGGSTSRPISTGLSLGNLQVSGGALEVINIAEAAQNRATFTSRSVQNGVPTGETLWTRYLYQAVDVPLASTVVLRKTDLTNGSGGGLRNTAKRATFTSGGVGITGTTDTNAAPTFNINNGDVYYILASFSDMNSSASVSHVGNWWAFDETGINALLASGNFSNANLSALAVDTATVTQTGTIGFDAFSLIAFGVNSSANTTTTFRVDELFVGTTVDAVIGTAIPEPSTYALMGLAFVGLAAVRRRWSC